jgi:hypothetical protein
MPLYPYVCDTCGSTIEEFRSVGERDAVGVHICKPGRSGYLERRRTTPHLSPIPGISNRLNRHWREGGKSVDEQLIKHGMSTER